MGVFLWYLSLWEYTQRNYTLVAFGGTMSPLIVASVAMVFLSAWLVTRIQAQYIMGMGVLSILAALILLGTMPVQQPYWNQAFPATILLGCGVDLVMAAAQIITSNAVSRHEQGLAGAIIGAVQTFGLSTGPPMGATVEVHTNRDGGDIVRGYRCAIFLAVGFCALALAVNVLFVRMPAETKEGWSEEDLPRRLVEKEKAKVVPSPDNEHRPSESDEKNAWLQV
jgi:MFS family permease